MNVTINKASLKDDLFLKGDYDEAMKDATRNVKFDDSNPVHKDLKTVFSGLAEHLRKLCQQPMDMEGEDNYTCIGFNIGSNDSGVTLTRTRLLDGGRVLNLNSPFTKWDQDTYNYPDIDALSELIQTGKSEVMAYLFEDKHAPHLVQTSMFDQEGQVNDEIDPGTTITFLKGGGELEGKTIPLGDLTAKAKRGRKPKVNTESKTPEADEVF